MMESKEYKVSFWFGANDGDTPDKVIYVITDKKEKREITALALKEVGAYPRTYQVLVEENDGIELYVVRLKNTKRANGEAWYYDRDGELFVVSKNGIKDVYETCHYLGVTSTRGYIKPQFCEVINTFNSEDTFS